MAYTSQVPLGTQKLNQTQPLILANFQALAPWGNGYGQFTNQASAPSFAAGVDGLYTLNYATSGLNEMFIHKQTFAGTSDIPFTASVLSFSTPTNNSSGFSFLPSGIMMRWDVTLSGTGLVTVTLGGTAPAFTNIYAIFLTPTSSSTSDVNSAVRLVNIISGTQFRVFFSSRTSSGAAAGTANAFIIGR